MPEAKPRHIEQQTRSYISAIWQKGTQMPNISCRDRLSSCWLITGYHNWQTYANGTTTRSFHVVCEATGI